MPDKGWKQAERRMAKDVGTKRLPCDGSRAGADFTDSIACYQLKVRGSISKAIWGWLTGIQGTALASGRAGVLVMKRPRQEDGEAIVMLSWKDWCDLHGTPKEKIQ